MSTHAGITAEVAAEAISLCATLTEDERGMLGLVAKGYTSREIGQFICRSTKTVEKHRCAILEKLNVESSIEAAVIAAKAGRV